MREAVLFQFDAFLDRVLYLKQVDGRFVTRAGDDVQRRVEHDVLNHGVARAAPQRLQSLAPVCAKNLDHCPSDGRGGDQSAVGVYREGAQLGLVRLNHAAHAVFRH